MQIRTAQELGALVRERRDNLGLTQLEVAERARVTREWLVRFENGKSTVALTRVLDVLTALDLAIDVEERDGR